jgi:B-cell CLL/lymphoma protein 3
MDEGPVDLRTRPKATAAPGAALPLRKRPLRPPSPEPAAPCGAAGPVAPLDPLRGGCDTPAIPGVPHGLARPEAFYYPGEWPPADQGRVGATQSSETELGTQQMGFRVAGRPEDGT